MNGLFGKTFDLLSTILDFRAERHKIIASNVANLDTPGFRPSSLDFGENLDEIMNEAGSLKMALTHPRHMDAKDSGGGDFRVSQSGEKVEVDKEMAELAENNIMYNANLEMLARKFKGLKTVLTEAK